MQFYKFTNFIRAKFCCNHFAPFHSYYSAANFFHDIQSIRTNGFLIELDFHCLAFYRYVVFPHLFLGGPNWVVAVFDLDTDKVDQEKILKLCYR